MNLQAGEVALYTDEGDRIHLKRGGVIQVLATTRIELVAPLVTFSGNVQVTGSLTATVDVIGGGKSLKTHTHGGVAPGGSNTGQPN